MLISRKQRFIFVHVPRTGGNSIKRALTDWSDVDVRGVFNGHAPASTLRKIVLNWEKYYTFAFVRNPWDYHVSMYHHILTMGARHPQWRDIGRFHDFREYMEKYVAPVRPLNHCDYVGNNGKAVVTFVGRYERLKDDFARCCQALDLPSIDLPVVNASERTDYRVYYDDHTKKLVATLNERDIRVFGYTF